MILLDPGSNPDDFRSIFGTSSRRGRRPPGPGMRPQGPPPPRPDEDQLDNQSVTPSMGRRGPPPRNRYALEQTLCVDWESVAVYYMPVNYSPYWLL